MSAAEVAGSDWEQRLLRYSSRPVELKPEYQELKFTLHRKLRMGEVGAKSSAQLHLSGRR